MICEASAASLSVAPMSLGTTDVPEMLELTAATEPGPFLPQTIQMGSYFGIRASDGRLVAMAGERLQSTAFAEISARCTHPEFRGRGYAQALTTFSQLRFWRRERFLFFTSSLRMAQKWFIKKLGSVYVPQYT